MSDTIKDMLGRTIIVGDVVANGMRDVNEGVLRIYRVLSIEYRGKRGSYFARGDWKTRVVLGYSLKVELLAASDGHPAGRVSRLTRTESLLKLPEGILDGSVF